MGLFSGFSWVQDLTINSSQYFRNWNVPMLHTRTLPKWSQSSTAPWTLLLTQELQKDKKGEMQTAVSMLAFVGLLTVEWKFLSIGAESFLLSSTWLRLCLSVGGVDLVLIKVFPSNHHSCFGRELLQGLVLHFAWVYCQTFSICRCLLVFHRHYLYKTVQKLCRELSNDTCYRKAKLPVLIFIRNQYSDNVLL